MAKYEIGLQRVDWLTVEADNLEEAIRLARIKNAHYDFCEPDVYEYIGGHRILEDNEENAFGEKTSDYPKDKFRF